MGIRITNHPEYPESAREFLDQDPRVTCFLAPEWIRAVVAGYPQVRPSVLVLEEDGRITGVLPWAEVPHGPLREVVSMPFGSHGGPVLGTEASEAGLAALIDAFGNRVRRPGTFRHELTLFDPGPRLVRALEPGLGRTVLETDVPVLDFTPGMEVVWEGYDQRLRRSVRRAGTTGVKLRRGRDAFEAFFHLYAAQSREWPLPWHHRRDRLERMIEALGNRAEIWVGAYHGTDLCAQLVLLNPEREIHLWLSGARPESRKMAAFHFLLHEIILDASQRGFRACHFGTSLGNPGVERFKLAYGAVQRPLFRYFHQPRWVGWIQKLRW